MSYWIEQGEGCVESPYEATVSEIAEEVIRSRKRFPSPDHLIVALAEATGDLAAVCLTHGPKSGEAKYQARQLAALAIRLIEEADPTLEGLNREALDLDDEP